MRMEFHCCAKRKCMRKHVKLGGPISYLNEDLKYGYFSIDMFTCIMKQGVHFLKWVRHISYASMC